MVVEKIDKIIYNPCKGLCLKHLITLGSVDNKDKHRRPEMNMYSYSLNKYSDVDKVTAMRIDTSEYLVLESSNREIDVSIFMSYQHIIVLKSFLKECLKQLEIDDLFIEVNNSVQINKKYNDLQIDSEDFIDGKYIIGVPNVEETDTEIREGIDLYFADDIYFFISRLQIEGLLDFLQTYNLYISSQLLLNYYSTIMYDQIDLNQFKSKRKTQQRHQIKDAREEQ